MASHLLIHRHVHSNNTLAVPESTPAVVEGPKNRYERLENRISMFYSPIFEGVCGAEILQTSWKFF